MTILAQLRPVVISLGAEAHHWAKVFATEQVNRDRQRQVYRMHAEYPTRDSAVGMNSGILLGLDV